MAKKKNTFLRHTYFTIYFLCDIFFNFSIAMMCENKLICIKKSFMKKKRKFFCYFGKSYSSKNGSKILLKCFSILHKQNFVLIETFYFFGENRLFSNKRTLSVYHFILIWDYPEFKDILFSILNAGGRSFYI